MVNEKCMFLPGLQKVPRRGDGDGGDKRMGGWVGLLMQVLNMQCTFDLSEPGKKGMQDL